VKEFTDNSKMYAACGCMNLLITVGQEFNMSLNKEH